MSIEILKHYIFHVQFFYSVCLLWESANKGKPKVGFIHIKYFGITCQENWQMKESKSMQCIADIVWEHNHSTTALQTLSYKGIN